MRNIMINTKGLTILIVILLCTIACSHTRNGAASKECQCTNPSMNENATPSDSSLVLLIHSGRMILEIRSSGTTDISEAHIIFCTPTTLKYGY